MPIYKPVDRQRMISDYIDAFRAANPDRSTPIIAYVRNRYRFKAKPADQWEVRGYLHRDMKVMLGRLRAAVGG